MNCKDRDGWTALHYAEKMDSVSIVKLLLNRTDLNVNAKDKIGETVLHGATKRRNEEVVKVLLENVHIELNARDRKGETPLVKAMKYRCAPIVKLLAAHPDVDLNPTNNEGRDVFALVSDEQKRYSGPIKRFVQIVEELEECLEILRAAIEQRSRERSLVSEEEESS